MPKWGIEMQEGTINAWHAVPGLAVAKGEMLLDVETDKIVNTIDSPTSGVLSRIVAAAGETQPVGALIGVLAGPEVTAAEVDAFIAGFRPADASFEPQTSAPPVTLGLPNTPPSSTLTTALQPPPATEPVDSDSRVSPIARRLAEKLGLDLSRVTGTGRNGRISRDDVESLARTLGLQAEGSPAAALANEPERVRMNSRRLTIARRLTEAKQTIPHFRLGADVDCDALERHRAELAARGTRVSVNDLLLAALARTLVEHRDLNARLEGEELLRFPHADICVAVATDAGLVAPVVRCADTKDAATIALEVIGLAERARSGRLAREEISGGSFTLSNLGMHGIERFDAILNPPQVGILAVGAALPRAIVRNGTVVAARVMTLTLSCDHRAVDGATGARFLDALKQRIEEGRFT